jgi:probable HAF family extracellular repeat protein
VTRSGFAYRFRESITAVLFLLLMRGPALGQGKGSSHPSAHLPRNQSIAPLIGRSSAANLKDIEQWALLQAYARWAPGNLPLDFEPAGEQKCGTSVAKAIIDHWGEYDESTKAQLRTFGFSPTSGPSRPQRLDSTRTTTHFKIHYSVIPGDSNAVSTRDADGNGTPDYVDTLMAVLEQVWDFELGAPMGYVVPPSDSLNGVDSVDGGDGRYDIYLKKLGSVYGETWPFRLVGDNPNSSTVVESNAWSSYITMRNNYNGFKTSGVKALEVTAAHEFYHAIQFGYDEGAMSWLQEATATWAEDEVYDDVNDNLQYLPKWFQSPWVPLDADDFADTSISYRGHWYGSWIFFRYVSEHVGGRDMVRSIWEHLLAYDNIHTESSFLAFDDAFADASLTFRDVFKDFGIANRFSSTIPLNYREWASYPRPTADPIAGDTTLTDLVYRHGTNYYRLTPNPLRQRGNAITVTFTPIDQQVDFGIQVATLSGGTLKRQEFTRSYPIIVTSQAIDTVVFIVSNFKFGGTTLNYKIQVASGKCDANAEYSIADLGTLGANYSYPARINAKGQVVGVSGIDSVHQHAFLWDHGKMTDLDSLSPSLNSSATSINNAGVIIGNDSIPFVIQGGVKTHLNSLVTLGPHFTNVSDINTAGQIAGWGNIGGDSIRALLYSGGVTSVLRTPFDGSYQPFSEAYALNNTGGVTGVLYQSTPFAAIPMLWKNDQFVKVLGGTATDARDINDLGQVVGTFAVYPDGVHPLYRAVMWDGNTETDLGVFPGVDQGEALAINNRSEIVGRLYNSNQPDFAGHAFIRKNGTLKDLNCLIPADTSWELQYAVDINDSGMIVGWGSHNGASHAFLLTSLGLTGVHAEQSVGIPREFVLDQNFPNPFNPSTTISYQLPVISHVALKVYDVLGREVATLANGVETPGQHRVSWNADRFASGVYFYRLETTALGGVKSFMATKKLVLLK